jgi:SAM-dependent methyltransferase
MAYNTIEYYDAESGAYSRKRYEGALVTYTQYLFRKRLQIFTGFLGDILPPERRAKMLEIGCADGIIMNRIAAAYPKNIEKIVGLDISPMMIETARERNHDPRLLFFLRDEAPHEQYDIVIELGVHIENWEEEVKYVKDNLTPGGHFLLSVAGKSSLHARIKLNGAEYLKDYKTYKAAEEIITSHFEIVEARVYGLFTPKLWAIPFLGRILQPVIDTIFRPMVPELFHEKIYLLKKK